MATVTGLTAARMQEIIDTTIQTGYIDAFGHLILVTYDLTEIDAGYVLASLPDASETVKGKVELATVAEATTGTDTVRAVTPAGLAAGLATVSIPDASETVKGKVELATDAEAVTGTDTVRAITPANLAAVVAATVASVLLSAHPVGSIYMSVSSTSPATLFGGTWAVWGEGRVPVSRHASSGTFNVAAETTGGAETHALSIAELAAHTHTGTTGNESTQASFPLSFNGGSGTASSGSGTNTRYGSGNAHTHAFTTNSTGSGTAHNNLQPYIVCYMWKRTA